MNYKINDMKNHPPHIGLMKKAVILILFLTGMALDSHAQLNPLQSMYFQNPYLYSPALAGMSNSLDINMDYSQQWSNFPGTPKTASFTADFQPADKVGLGIDVNNETAGLIKQTMVMGSYAYHLPVGGNNQKLNFGLSLGLNSSRVDNSEVVGDEGDDEIEQYNQQKPYVDGQLGVVYTSNNLSIGGTIPDLKYAFFKTSDDRFDADQLLFISMASYKFFMQNEDRDFTLEPLVAYRVVRGYNSIVDAGFNFAMKNTGIYLQGMYHSSKSMNLGFGLDEDTYAVNFSYNIDTGPINTYANGTLEVGITIRLFGKKR